MGIVLQSFKEAPGVVFPATGPILQAQLILNGHQQFPVRTHHPVDTFQHVLLGFGSVRKHRRVFQRADQQHIVKLDVDVLQHILDRPDTDLQAIAVRVTVGIDPAAAKRKVHGVDLQIAVQQCACHGAAA